MDALFVTQRANESHGKTSHPTSRTTVEDSTLSQQQVENWERSYLLVEA